MSTSLVYEHNVQRRLLHFLAPTSDQQHHNGAVASLASGGLASITFKAIHWQQLNLHTMTTRNQISNWGTQRIVGSPYSRILVMLSSMERAQLELKVRCKMQGMSLISPRSEIRRPY